MQVTVQEVREAAHGARRGTVVLTSPVGRFRAKWAEDELPRVGGVYFVELEIGQPAVLGVNAFHSETPRYSIASDSGHVALNVVLERLEPDGVAFFRLALDLVMIETSRFPAGATALADQGFEENVWFRLMFPLAQVRVYDERL